MKTAYVTVNVATVWTKANLPRKQDYYATTAPADIPAWLSGLTHHDRIWFIDENILQTQVLYGSQVLVTEESGEWSRVLIPDQFTPKNEQGYPGWIPTRQIEFHEEYDRVYAAAPSVWVTVPRAQLNTDQKKLELSYLTRLPLLRVKEKRTHVLLPSGKEGWLANQDVTIRSEAHIAESPCQRAPYPMLQKRKGHDIVEAGKRFLGLPYLWSGMSSFGYDCSGFSHSMHKASGILIPRDASAQYKFGREHGFEVNKENLKAGDLVYFANERGYVDHVGIYAGDGDFLHASNSNYVVKIQPLWEGKYLQKFCGAMRFW
ncbi:NlpC/P60 family protein [Ammoniphilus sp. 3BR4]|uniref:C40 family peptidase n=1 Tax=Ammoniphilus sp. 3BR4 TaxID=3158265 RepID=UPI0034676BB7